MAATPSTMKPLGYTLPSFQLLDTVTGIIIDSTKLEKNAALLVMFICNHCPYVKHILSEFKNIQDDYTNQGLRILAINANDVEHYPDDDPKYMKALALEQGWNFPYLFDETQAVAREFEAACTPDFYLFDASRKLVYRGQFDDSRPRNSLPVTGKDLRRAIEATLSHASIDGDQKPSLGCNIKWRINSSI